MRRWIAAAAIAMLLTTGCSKHRHRNAEGDVLLAPVDRKAMIKARDGLRQRSNDFLRTMRNESTYAPADVKGVDVANLLDVNIAINAENLKLLQQFDKATGESDADLIKAVQELDYNTTTSIQKTMYASCNEICKWRLAVQLGDQAGKSQKLIGFTEQRIDRYLSRTSGQETKKHG